MTQTPHSSKKYYQKSSLMSSTFFVFAIYILTLLNSASGGTFGKEFWKYSLTSSGAAVSKSYGACGFWYVDDRTSQLSVGYGAAGCGVPYNDTIMNRLSFDSDTAEIAIYRDTLNGINLANQTAVQYHYEITLTDSTVQDTVGFQRCRFTPSGTGYQSSCLGGSDWRSISFPFTDTVLADNNFRFYYVFKYYIYRRHITMDLYVSSDTLYTGVDTIAESSVVSLIDVDSTTPTLNDPYKKIYVETENLLDTLLLKMRIYSLNYPYEEHYLKNETEDASSIPQCSKISITDHAVYAMDNILHFKGFPQGTTVDVFNIRGDLLKRRILSNAEETLFLSCPGFYIVKTEKESWKLFVR